MVSLWTSVSVSGVAISLSSTWAMKSRPVTVLISFVTNYSNYFEFFQKQIYLVSSIGQIFKTQFRYLQLVFGQFLLFVTTLVLMSPMTRSITMRSVTILGAPMSSSASSISRLSVHWSVTRHIFSAVSEDPARSHNSCPVYLVSDRDMSTVLQMGVVMNKFTINQQCPDLLTAI